MNWERCTSNVCIVSLLFEKRLTLFGKKKLYKKKMNYRLTLLIDNFSMKTMSNAFAFVTCFIDYPLFRLLKTSWVGRWINKYVSRSQDNESVFHVSESLLYKAVSLIFWKGALFCTSYCKAKNQPVLTVLPVSSQFGDMCTLNTLLYPLEILHYANQGCFGSTWLGVHYLNIITQPKKQLAS